MSRAAAILFISLAACGSGSGGPLFGGFTPTSGAAYFILVTVKQHPWRAAPMPATS